MKEYWLQNQKLLKKKRRGFPENSVGESLYDVLKNIDLGGYRDLLNPRN